MLSIASNSKSSERTDRVNFFYVLEQHARDPKTKDRPFIVYNGQSWTYHETYVLALRYGTWFKQVHGVKSREVVAMDFMNSSTFVFIWMGLWSIGAAPAFINYNLTGQPLTHSVRASSARLLLVEEELRQKFTSEQLELFASPDFRDGGDSVNLVFFTPEVEAQILGMEPTREDDTARSGTQLRDMATLIYTSGTTGLPKPAILPWRKVWAGAVMTNTWLKMTKDDRMFTVRFFDTLLFLNNTNPIIVHASLSLIRSHPRSHAVFVDRIGLDHRSQVLCSQLHAGSRGERCNYRAIRG